MLYTLRSLLEARSSSSQATVGSLSSSHADESQGILPFLMVSSYTLQGSLSLSPAVSGFSLSLSLSLSQNVRAPRNGHDLLPFLKEEAEGDGIVRAMEPEEIAVVLVRASELHSKLSDAISFVVQDAPSPSSSRIQDLQNGDGSSELRSLSSIRDALEVLEEQLESLQALQQQQQADRDAGLAEIEESRRVFLKQLKDYRGRELEVVQEALAFAGGTIPDKDEVPPSGYPLVDDDTTQTPLVSLPSGMSGRGQRQDLHEGHQRRNEMFGFEVEEGQEEGSEGDSTFEDDDERDPDSLIGAVVRAANAVRNSVASSGAFVLAFNAVKSSVTFLGHLVGQISGQVTGPPSKVVLIVVSTLAVLSLTDLGERRTKSVARVSRMPAHRSHQHHICNSTDESSSHGKTYKSHRHGSKANLPQGVEKPPVQGENHVSDSRYMKSEDDFPNCVVRERLELPFYQELQTPDILHGRG